MVRRKADLARDRSTAPPSGARLGESRPRPIVGNSDVEYATIDEMVDVEFAYFPAAPRSELEAPGEFVFAGQHGLSCLVAGGFEKRVRQGDEGVTVMEGEGRRAEGILPDQLTTPESQNRGVLLWGLTVHANS